MKKIIFASNNNGKIREVREILKDFDVELMTMKEAGINLDIEENGTTFEENALIKARAVMELTGEITMADDSGLEVDYLDKAPGVYSARFMGHDTSYDIKNKAIIDKLEGVSQDDRSARFVCVIATVFPDGKELTARGTMEGRIAYEPMGENGFGYDPIMYIPQYDRSSAQLTSEEKNKISHRGEALNKMKQMIEKYL